MATIMDAIGGYLAAYAGLHALIGDGAIFQVRAEQDFTTSSRNPYVVYEVSPRPLFTLSGCVANEGTLRVRCFAGNPDDAQAVADQVRAAFDGIGLAGTTPKVMHCIETDRDDEDDEQFGLFGKRSTYALLFANS